MLTDKRPAGVTGHQFYVTHCVTADSVSNSPGYSIRASSVRDDDVLREVLEYPPYELPLDMWKGKPAQAQTPRRLARTRHPHGGVWAVHSVYLEKDTMDRDRSYFSHLLHLSVEDANPASILESWDAAEWTKQYAVGAPRLLPRAGIPIGRAISRRKLISFLSRPRTGSTDLSSAVCPARLQTDSVARRDLVARFLQAVILVTGEKDAGGPRDRLFVHAEPGLVAMLLYAATRILPPQFTANLTFSTFEPAHRAIRDYKLATVVGTFLGVPGRGLGPELALGCGYVLDAIEAERSSPELSGWTNVPDGIPQLIGLAANGKWELLAKVHRRVGTSKEAISRVAKTIGGRRAPRKSRESRPKFTTLELGSPAADPSALPANALPAKTELHPRKWKGGRARLGAISACVFLGLIALVVWSLNRHPDLARANRPADVTIVNLPAVSLPSGTGKKPEKKSAPSEPAKKLPPVGAPESLDPALTPRTVTIAPPPRAAGSFSVLTETIGMLSAVQLYQTHLNIGILANLRLNGPYTAGELAKLLASVVSQMDQFDRQLEKVAMVKELNDEDVVTLTQVRRIASLLREQGKSLQAFWATGVEDHGKRYEESRQAAWKELDDLLGLSLKPDVSPEPKPVGKKP